MNINDLIGYTFLAASNRVIRGEVENNLPMIVEGVTLYRQARRYALTNNISTKSGDLQMRTATSGLNATPLTSQ